MATIQIADKPTVDAIKALLEGSGGVKGYPNVSVVTIAKDSTAKITGKGKVSIPCGGSMYLVSIDDVAYNRPIGYSTMATPFVVSFEKNIAIKHTSDNSNYNAVLVQLSD